ncbi:hypothetical protein FJZ53_02450 [Candidatus Woesearchaeota archaeon]|nr:hypothetical protein [Candidatus Woesearchaeota archaeon]
MKAKILTYMLAASLLTAPIISGCTQHREHKEKPKVVYQIQSKDWGVKAEERYGKKTVEAYKNGYRIKIEEKRDGSYEVKVKIPERK